MAAQILIADDDSSTLRTLSHALEREGYQVHLAQDGAEALQQVEEQQPDLLILDVVMPQLDGHEVCRRLRRRPEFARIPIIILTAQSSQDEKVRFLDAGADDYLTKPFHAPELLARIKVLLRRAGERTREEQEERIEGKIIAVYSLRGGVGVSTLAANMATGLSQLWNQPAVLVDLAHVAGHSTIMLNITARTSWAEISTVPADEIEIDMLNKLLLPHSSGAFVLPAPNYDESRPSLKPEQLSKVLTLLSQNYHYVVLDLPDNMHNTTVTGLDTAHEIWAIMAPDMASLTTMRAMLEFFESRHYHRNNIHLVLNHLFKRKDLERVQIESVLSRPFELEIPFTEQVVEAINIGVPLIVSDPDLPASIMVEDFIFNASKEEHRKQTPEKPSKAWQRVTSRLEQQDKKGLRQLFKFWQSGSQQHGDD